MVSPNLFKLSASRRRRQRMKRTQEERHAWEVKDRVCGPQVIMRMKDHVASRRCTTSVYLPRTAIVSSWMKVGEVRSHTKVCDAASTRRLASTHYAPVWLWIRRRGAPTWRWGRKQHCTARATKKKTAALDFVVELSLVSFSCFLSL
jgi:hypothetical protein